ncbi:MAG: hypothetical protein M1833_006241 [Piccolia ochrophora]|nr:MAG: hypothetical protein M1833_006241 [Piccolia ochrophora]
MLEKEKPKKRHPWRRFLHRKEKELSPEVTDDVAMDNGQEADDEVDVTPASRDLKSPGPSTPSPRNADKPLPLPPPPGKRNEEQSSPSPQRVMQARKIIEPLNHDTIRNLFSGAPHFTVQPPGHSRGHPRPEVSFPWDASLEIRDLRDCPRLSHQAFSLSTVRRHLPHHRDHDGDDDQEHKIRFDTGVVETPSMTTAQGLEPGTCGFEHYLELPIADAWNNAQIGEGDHDKGAVPSDESTPGPARDPSKKRPCPLGPDERAKLGMRDLDDAMIVQRLGYLAEVYSISGKDDTNSTLITHHSSVDLYRELFTGLLYPPERVTETDADDPYSLRVQIKALLKVLNLKDIWLDFSKVESRILLGQILWGRRHPTAKRELQPLLTQILLACELLLRLESVVKNDGLIDEGGLQITGQDIEEFDGLRRETVDWDLIMAQRWLENMQVVKPGPEESLDPAEEGQETKRRRWFKHAAPKSDELSQNGSSFLDITTFLPRHTARQRSGLLLFAHSIKWPGLDGVLECLEEHDVPPSSIDMLPQGPSPDDSDSDDPQLTQAQLEHGPHQLKIELHPSSSRRGDVGWISKFWLSGLVLPGEISNHLLISTLLELSPQILRQIGTTANLYGGFVHANRSWWSANSVVGRVMAAADGSSQCGDWISCAIVPSGVTEGWVDIEFSESWRSPREEKPRVNDAERVARQANILGSDDGSTTIFSDDLTLPVDNDDENANIPDIVLASLRFDPPPSLHPFPSAPTSIASATFTLPNPHQDATATTSVLPREISITLAHPSRFLTAYPCRPPTSAAAHPLHKSHAYSQHPLTALLSAEHHDALIANDDVVKVIDARGPAARQVLARAWCASEGFDAVVARKGRTCIGCAVREARAVGVRFIVRV